MSLTVVTHTAGNRSDLLARCVHSVESQLPIGAKHRIIQTTDFAAARIASLDLDEIIVFVDDDDLVVNDSLNVCASLLASNDVGMVFTREQEIDLNGNHIVTNCRASVTYQSIATSHSVVHHLAMFRPQYVVETRKIWKQHQNAVCWMIKAEAAIKGGALYVPFVGYQWTRHADGMSVTLPFTSTADTTRKVIQSWLTPATPTHVPNASFPLP